MKTLTSILILITFVIGCKPTEVTFTGDPQFDKEYLQPFLVLAQQYEDEYNVKYNRYKLSISLVDDLPDPNDPSNQLAGLSVWDDYTIYFNVNHPFWNTDAKQAIIYHEFGHYLLNKSHIDESVSCDVPFSLMSMWSQEHSPIQFEYWISGKWREYESYYIEELFRGSLVWKKYPEHDHDEPYNISHDIAAPCWE